MNKGAGLPWNVVWLLQYSYSDCDGGGGYLDAAVFEQLVMSNDMIQDT